MFSPRVRCEMKMPERALELSHDPGVPADPAWVRWSGGIIGIRPRGVARGNNSPINRGR